MNIIKLFIIKVNHNLQYIKMICDYYVCNKIFQFRNIFAVYFSIMRRGSG